MEALLARNVSCNLRKVALIADLREQNRRLPALRDELNKAGL
jgi:hypothetical protein